MTVKHLGKEVQRQLGKQRWRLFIAGKISFSVQQNVMENNIEYSLDLCLTVRKWSFSTLFFLVPGVPCCPEGAVWQNNIGTGASPAAQLRWRRAPLQAVSLPRLPSGSCSESVDLSPVKWEGNHTREKEFCHALQKEERNIKWACHWDSLVLTQAGLPGANPVLEMNYINPDD